MAYYQIYHNGKLISNSTNETLEIRNLDIFKEGNYRCIPVNNLGEVHAVELNLTVQGVYGTSFLLSLYYYRKAQKAFPHEDSNVLLVLKFLYVILRPTKLNFK